MKLVKIGIAASVLAIGLTPAHARQKDGENGYVIGCLIGWYVFGLDQICQELR